MRHTTPIVALTLTAALALTASPAHAQQRHGARQGDERGRAVPRGSERDPRGGPSTRAEQRRPAEAQRPFTVFRDAPRNRGAYDSRSSVRLAPRVLGSRAIIIGGSRLSRPYYSFRPRVTLSLGLWAGYPVAYPYYETPYVYGAPYDPYAYGNPGLDGYSEPYGYPSSGGLQPGGLSFLITPQHATVFIDGVYIGAAEQFGPTYQPLGLVPGRHRVELRASGFRTVAFEANVIAGQVVPYRATMRGY